jgi:hypothetical protein
MLALLNHRGPTFTRWLSLFLVVFILYGFTVEAAHRRARAPLRTSITNKAKTFRGTSLVATTASSANCTRISAPLKSRCGRTIRRRKFHSK